MPAFCRVAATLTPTSDSSIGIEVWMPSATWNGKFEGVGNGGYAGLIPYSAIAPGVSLGYATVGTDTGHIGSSTDDGSFALGHPEKIIDFGYRSIHLMTFIGKQISSAFYGEDPLHSYFTGCSTGGRQALMEAQRYANDYDGIVAGDPVAHYTHHHVGGNLWVVWQMFNNPASTVFTTQDTLLGNAVNAACDALDGVADGVLNDPRRCHYDPAALQCTSSQMPPSCLTAEQIEAVRHLWTGPDEMVGKSGYYPPFERGGEIDGWPSSISPERPPAPQTDSHAQIGIPFFEYFVFDNSNWNFPTFDWATDPAYVESKVVVPGQTLASVLNSIDPDLQPFEARGGKLIQYHGFSDPEVPPLSSINYFESVVKFPSGSPEWQQTSEFYRLFMVPGMNHCKGGPGANVFDMLSPLVDWVEQDVAPNRILATHYVNNEPDQGVAFTRPLCSYPREAVYKGSGNTNDAANFACK
ncbi:MAG TPA: tannase/feruloyl esterase family alpha/beta hydrolase [Terriglobales bacterium]|nr:tannase/feruloyl esterase family alpha/beta hydrolase [Terriglobales bacterium]